MYLVFEQDTLTMFQLFFLFFALFTAFAFEFINGFHDTANAVATVIYTHSLKPARAVLISGICNFLGVLFGGTAVAFTIVHLLPIEIIQNIGSGPGQAMLLSLLVAAIIWNFATWFKGIPASSSHTLIGSIIGVGIAHSFITGMPYGSPVTWHKITDVFIALLTSPVVGYILTFLLMLGILSLKWLKSINISPKEMKHPKNPPMYIRAPIIISSAAVSFTHGSNDGQKGMGLIMLILIAMLPGHFALNMDCGEKKLATAKSAICDMKDMLENIDKEIQSQLTAQSTAAVTGEQKTPAVQERVGKFKNLMAPELTPLVSHLKNVYSTLENKKTLTGFTKEELKDLRMELIMIDESIKEMTNSGKIKFDKEERAQLKAYLKDMRSLVEYIPYWVIISVAIALGMGTMIGWKRVVVTVGEQIGKRHMTYSQGMAAQLIAAITIFTGNVLGLPVSTTHILSSGVAGGMAANKSGLHSKTVINILLAWILTLPVSMLLAALLYSFFRLFI